MSQTSKSEGSAAVKNKGKAKCSGDERDAISSDDTRLATLDIFAGCGGLSEGLQRSGKLPGSIILIACFSALLDCVFRRASRCLHYKVGYRIRATRWGGFLPQPSTNTDVC